MCILQSACSESDGCILLASVNVVTEAGNKCVATGLWSGGPSDRPVSGDQWPVHGVPPSSSSASTQSWAH